MEIIMNKIPCDIIRDLLPLYKDDVCSKSSKDLIEEHLSDCEDCRRYLDALDMELPFITLSSDSTAPTDGIDPQSLEDIEIFKKIAHRINWMKVSIGFFTMLITVMIISLVTSVFDDFYLEIPGFDRRIATDDIQVTALYQLENGDLFLTLESSVPFNITAYGLISSPDGRPYTESYDNGQSCLSFERVSVLERIFADHVNCRKYSFVIPRQETLDPEKYLDIYPEDPADTGLSSVVHRNSLIYYEGKHDEQLIIWKAGQEVSLAPAAIEKKVRQKQYEAGDEGDKTNLLWPEE